MSTLRLVLVTENLISTEFNIQLYYTNCFWNMMHLFWGEDSGWNNLGQR